MGFRFSKSIRLGGGARLNLSRRGIGASWGVKGFRVGVSPRSGGYTRIGGGLFSLGRSGGTHSQSGCGASGCLMLVAALIAIPLVIAIVRGIVAIVTSPITWIVVGINCRRWPIRRP